ncbi:MULTISPECIES: murein transglycosylase A [Comamonas]|nr:MULTISPECIES: MltA domain-containing protein [Comamonas]MDH1291668.1 MltA domain-containing protein [Comamonas terrigena]MDH1502218.1 MltA domain-containing protein [Comamonas terrigena]
MNLSLLLRASLAVIVGSLVACSSPPKPTGSGPLPSEPSIALGDGSDAEPLPPTALQPKSRWVPVRWAELPGVQQDALHEAWNAMLKSCERPSPAFSPLCGEVRRMSLSSEAEQQLWLRSRLQPYRVEGHDGRVDGMLTSYYEPQIIASRQPTAEFNIPLYALPAGRTAKGGPWYTRQQIETLPAAQAALQGKVIAWMNDPVEAMVLHIQGSGRLQITEPDGRVRQVRVAYAGTNDQPYKSIGRWLLDQGLVRDATWPGIKAWIAQNPGRTQELMWSNPRYVFFREEALEGVDINFGPKGAQGVALTPGRSIAVDRGSIPYGTPVWLHSTGPQVSLSRLVLAQDTGSAIVGAVRADYFMGWGHEAGELAGRIKQNLRLWVLWPKGVPVRGG